MTENEITTIQNLLKKVYNINYKYCDYDCCNCNYGILTSYGAGFSCSLEFVIDNLNYDNRIRMEDL